MTLQEQIDDMVRKGADDAAILARFGISSNSRAKVRHLIALARMAHERDGGVKRRGPWPVSYVRSDGQRVFRVGPGHDVPEGSLKAFGFEAA